MASSASLRSLERLPMIFRSLTRFAICAKASANMSSSC